MIDLLRSDYARRDREERVAFGRAGEDAPTATPATGPGEQDDSLILLFTAAILR